MPTKLPVALDERVEFASKEWRATIESELRRRLGAVRDELRDVRWSMCEVFTDAPPHLSHRDGVIAHQLRIDGGEFAIVEGESDDVDFKATGDYNKAVEVAAAVYRGDAAIRERTMREHAHRYGADVFQVKGEPPVHPVLLEILTDLHDHMARRTVPNRDLTHRIEHLGLSRNRDELDTQGYTIIERAFSDDFADELCAELHRVIDETSGKGTTVGNYAQTRGGLAGRLLGRGRLFEEAAQNPLAHALGEHMVGQGCLLYTGLGFRKVAGEDTHSVHSDYALIQEPYPAYTVICGSIWALEDFDEGAGPTLLVPGSFKHNRAPRPGEGVDELVPVLMPKGSIAMWRGNTWHSAGVRTKPGYRVTLHMPYSRLHIRPTDGYLDIDPAILERNSPVISTLCGLDDLFQKSDDAGPYMEGVQYASQHYIQPALT